MKGGDGDREGGQAGGVEGAREGYGGWWWGHLGPLLGPLFVLQPFVVGEEVLDLLHRVVGQVRQVLDGLGPEQTPPTDQTDQVACVGTQPRL